MVTARAFRSTVRGVRREEVVKNRNESQAGLAVVFRLVGLEEQSGNSGVRRGRREELS